MARPRSTICCECHERPRLENAYRCSECNPAYQARQYQRRSTKKKLAERNYANKPGIRAIRSVQKKIRTVSDKPANAENMAKYTKLVEELHALKQQHGVRDNARSL